MVEKAKNKWYAAIKILVVLAILSFIASGFLSYLTRADFKDGNVAVIPVKGVIMTEKGGILGQQVVSSAVVVGFIEKADKNPKIKAIILEIDSPGGSPVGSEEIANAVKKTNKTTVAWIREVGASGGYWVASSADKIVASRMSFTGSIGVLASYLDFSGFLEDHNVTYERLVAGKYKDIGSPFKELSMQERRLLQDKLDLLHSYFISEVAENRNLPKEKVEELATGIFFLGYEAKELGLIDVIGGKEEAVKIIEKELNITAELVEYKEEIGFIDLLSEVFSEQSFYIGKGIGSSIFDAKQANSIKIFT